MITIHENDYDKVAVVVVGYNRLDAIRRLLKSLLMANFGEVKVPLVVSVDCSNDGELYQYVREFQWPFGNKYIIIQEKRLGLKKHILQCGNLSQQFRAIILLEDDIFVSEYFYHYTLQALNAFEDDDRIGGISLYSNDICDINVPVYYYHDGSDCYLRQRPATWGECWSKRQWFNFMKWYDNFEDSDFSRIDMPEEMKKWEKAWSKYFMAYLIETDRYILYPHVSLTTCFSEPGEHYDLVSMAGQYNILHGEKRYSFNSFEDMVSYDIYWTNNAIYKWMGMTKDELCVDWYGMSSNKRNCRYLLTPMKLPYPIVKSYGLSFYPIEMNVKCEINGNDIFLYDLVNCEVSPSYTKRSKGFIYYYLQKMNISMLRRYVVLDLYMKVKSKLRKFRIN